MLVWVQRTPSLTHELGRVYDRLVDHDRPMPELGDWAMSASSSVWMLDRLSDPSVRTILELGSGSSTIWFATALAKRGGEGRVVALESSADYAESTRTELAKHGLRDRAQVFARSVGRHGRPWPGKPAVVRHLGAARPAAGRSVVRGRAGRRDRSPGALPGISAAGRPSRAGSDGCPRRHRARRAEAAIVKAWKQESFRGRRLREVRRLDRATAFVSEDL